MGLGQKEKPPVTRRLLLFLFPHHHVGSSLIWFWFIAVIQLPRFRSKTGFGLVNKHEPLLLFS
ncbi:MAG: hypothetical protein CVU11_06010 [Bacteroidetes bacterium HGW-Bacteroidetes-6]|nr:MAG: hypothetical protein CVU11_06010 [Bacteroidetes bacterium HGW-Bacteroidetes-6]